MEKYWDKRTEIPTEVNTDSASSESGGEDSLSETEDDGSHANNCASSVAACSSPVDDCDDDNPATSFAKYRAEQAAKAKRSGHFGWRAELRSWNQSLSPKHTENMDLVEYWQVCICIRTIMLLLIYPYRITLINTLLLVVLHLTSYLSWLLLSLPNASFQAADRQLMISELALDLSASSKLRS